MLQTQLLKGVQMTDIRRLPVLSLSDVVVLPGMVVPIELDEHAQAALDADGR